MDIIPEIFSKYRDGLVSLDRAVSAILAYQAALVPEEFLSDQDGEAFETFIRQSLTRHRSGPRSTGRYDMSLVVRVGEGDRGALNVILEKAADFSTTDPT